MPDIKTEIKQMKSSQFCSYPQAANTLAVVPEEPCHNCSFERHFTSKFFLPYVPVVSARATSPRCVSLRQQPSTMATPLVNVFSPVELLLGCQICTRVPIMAEKLMSVTPPLSTLQRKVVAELAAGPVQLPSWGATIETFKSSGITEEQDVNIPKEEDHPPVVEEPKSDLPPNQEVVAHYVTRSGQVVKANILYDV
ncbi:hypothetical protein CHUAL_009669 [Chamberlinius hualienensis]